MDNGWTYRSGSWQKVENYRTQKIALNLLVKADDSSKVSVAENIKTQLANQGIIINIQQASGEQYNGLVQARSYDILLGSITVSPSPDLNLFLGDGNLAN